MTPFKEKYASFIIFSVIFYEWEWNKKEEIPSHVIAVIASMLVQ